MVKTKDLRAMSLDELETKLLECKKKSTRSSLSARRIN